MKQKIIVGICLVLMSMMYSQEKESLEQLDSIYLDTKKRIPRKSSGKVVAMITSETLENSNGRSVAEILNQVSGIEIIGSRSNAGQNLGYTIRGGRNRQVVILMDGVQLNDPSHISNDYDLRLIPASSIESIEIIKGASSVLYGSGAATGVISINSKKASGSPISATFSSTFGTNRSVENEAYDAEEFTNNVLVNGTLGKFEYLLSFNNRYVEGLSAVAAGVDQEALEEDIFDRFDGRINLGYRVSRKLKINRFFSFDKYKAGFDDFSYVDAANVSVSDQKRTGGTIKWSYNKGSITINDNYSWMGRRLMSSFPTRYDSKSYTFDAFVNQKLTNQISMLLGMNGNFSSFNAFSIPFGANSFNQDINEEVAKSNTMDPYLNLVYRTKFGLNINTGARLNIHSKYGKHVVYNVNPSFNINLGGANLKFLGSYSSAYIAPSLYQLYDPLYGNEMLNPEENITIEGGIEFSSKNMFRASVVYFNRTESSFIDFVLIDPELYMYQYKNSEEEFNVNGVEIEISKRFENTIDFSANYTFTKVEQDLKLRIPEHKVNASLGYALAEKTELRLLYQYVGDREDSFFNSETFENETINLNGYGLWDLSASHRFNRHVKLYATVSNVFDKEYEEIYRFQTRGRNVRFGFALTF
jgi:vitamin B12 transporter